MDYAIAFLHDLPTIGVLAFVCFITFFENVFPPSPSDMLLVFCGTLVGFSTTGFVPMVLAATVGSVLGFSVMYWVGLKFGSTMVESGKLRFLSLDTIYKAEHWFQHYGFWIIIANRFLSGTRAVISVFAGISRLPFSKTVILSAISAAVWNAILVGAGTAVGKNWMKIQDYLALYGQIVGGVVVVAILAFVIHKFVISKRSANP